ncbi:LysR family transcriptional regulator [Thermithiobacillus plumbiphilus]|uniref:LysR family transcriptional regulator n=1 Tax=Thermithiobacillus plumbiphilus TaxID=1729899 RepID=A0ABU9D454_9PROT
MDTRALRYFVAIHEAGSISAASRRLFVAQPALSSMLAQLEDQLGTILFVRHRKGVTVTEDGQKLYAHARRILGELGALENLFQTPAETAPLHLALMPALSAARVGEFLKQLLVNQPQLKLRLAELGEEAEARLVAERLRRTDENFVPLWEERYVLALPHGHALTLKPAIRLQDLHGLPLIERCQCELHDEVASALARYRVEPEIVARAQHEEWALALVAAGVGVALLPEGSVQHHPDITTRPLEGLRLSRRVGLAYDPGTPPSFGLQAALDTCRNHAKMQAAG